ncbi:uncharacterized protein LOC128213637 [Mya arenaria]|uniref:uncharacterized protein LOC128213637 n=1 Tax=Mya arenaria TaxID=6604 RepID=UPI0022E595C1|nr:uncharacterized protein LOC128213637 [Mya arenaria]
MEHVNETEFAEPEREIFFARKIENYCLPETFEDSLENCATIEVEDTKLCYREEAIQINACEHGYSKNREFATTEESSTQTDTSQTSGGYKPEDIIAGNDGNTRFYTGFPTYAVFMLFFQTFIKHGADRLTYWEGQKRTLQDKSQKELPSKPGRKRKLRPIDEFFMVCVRLRLGLLQQHLADLFCVSTMTVSRVMSTWINFMYDHMKGLIPWPTKEQILTNLPKCFQEISDSRIVIDAIEFFCEKPSSLKSQNVTWSEYKHHNTFKVLVGVAPNGLVTFISTVWGGHTSDRHITQEDGHIEGSTQYCRNSIFQNCSGEGKNFLNLYVLDIFKVFEHNNFVLYDSFKPKDILSSTIEHKR